MFSRTYKMFFNGTNIFEGFFIIWLCLQVTFLGLCHTYNHHKVTSDILLSSKSVQNDNIANFSKEFSFGVNKELGKFYYIRDSSKIKRLYMWQKGKLVQVDASSILQKPFIKAEREVIKSSSCTFKRQTITSKNNLKSQNCTTILGRLDEFTYHAFQEEIDVQIAYSILVYKDYEMIELLLRTIYKPQNTYCIHIDDKSSEAFKQRVRSFAACFENVFIATKLVKVYWGTFSVLEAEMSCMKELLNKAKSWKYFINLTGQEFPLRTNYEIAKVLDALRGFNNLRCTAHFKKSDDLLIPPPYNLTAYKTSAHVVLTRSFVEYLLYNETAKAILNWSQKLKIPPDEIAFSTVNCNSKLKAPGSFEAKTSIYSQKKNFVARFKIWIGKTKPGCHGQRLRGICNFGPKDLKTLKRRHELFANKFNIREFPQVPYCLRNTLLKRTYLEYTGHLDYNVSYYESIPYKI